MSDHDLAFERTLELAVLLDEETERRLVAEGLTRARAEVLWELHLRGPVPQRALAHALAVSARNITGLVDGLVTTGFVTREPHPTDRRATHITLTDRGAQVVRTMAKARKDLAKALFADLLPDQMAAYTAGVTRAVDTLRSRSRDQTD